MQRGRKPRQSQFFWLPKEFSLYATSKVVVESPGWSWSVAVRMAHMAVPFATNKPLGEGLTAAIGWSRAKG
jgi:hypothetical protein